MVISILTLDMDTGRNTKVSKMASWTIIPSKQGAPCYIPTPICHCSYEGLPSGFAKLDKMTQ